MSKQVLVNKTNEEYVAETKKIRRLYCKGYPAAKIAKAVDRPLSRIYFTINAQLDLAELKRKRDKKLTPK